MAMADALPQPDASPLIGLFRSVRPMCANASPIEAPAFLVGRRPDSGESQVQTIPPLGCIKFVVQERVLPPISSISVRCDSSLKVGGRWCSDGSAGAVVQHNDNGTKAAVPRSDDVTKAVSYQDDVAVQQ